MGRVRVEVKVVVPLLDIEWAMSLDRLIDRVDPEPMFPVRAPKKKSRVLPRSRRRRRVVR